MKDAAVHGSGRDDHPEVRALRQQVLGESQEDVRVDRALVDLVEDEAGVVAQLTVLGEELVHIKVLLQNFKKTKLKTITAKTAA
jgi:hypothetical protein